MIDIKIEELVKLKEQGMSDKEIAEHLNSQGIQISFNTVRNRLSKYYSEIGQEKPRASKSKMKITDQELYALKEQGMSDKEIEEYLKSQGIDISFYEVNKRLCNYYSKIGKPKPKVAGNKSKKITNITDEQLYVLKEQGMSDKEIEEHLKSQGINISIYTINKRLCEYYNKIGKAKPRALGKRAKRKVNVADEQVYELKEKGLSNKEIQEYLDKQGIKISLSTIGKKLTEYYKKIGKKKPKVKNTNNRIDITDEDLYELKEKGMTDKEILEHLKRQGIEMSIAGINKRLTKYYKKIGKEKPRAKNTQSKIDIRDEVLYKLKERGMTDKQISEHLKEEGVKISPTGISKRLAKYYKTTGKPKPKPKLRIKVNITNEELYELKMQGMSSKQIAEYFTRQGKKISLTRVNKRLINYCKSLEQKKAELESKEKVKSQVESFSFTNQIDKKIVYMLLSGTTIKENEFNDEQTQAIIKRIQKLKFIAEHSNKIGDRWIADEKFIAVLQLLENPEVEHPESRYIVYIKQYLKGRLCQHGNIELIKKNVFKENEDLMIYVLSNLQLEFNTQYDGKVWDSSKVKYKEKIDTYFERLYALEERKREKKQTTSRKVVKQGEER